MVIDNSAGLYNPLYKLFKVLTGSKKNYSVYPQFISDISIRKTVMADKK